MHESHGSLFDHSSNADGRCMRPARSAGRRLADVPRRPVGEGGIGPRARPHLPRRAVRRIAGAGHHSRTGHGQSRPRRHARRLSRPARRRRRRGDPAAFPLASGGGEQARGRGLRPRHRRRPGGGGGDAGADPARPARSRHSRRGIRLGAARRRTRVGARPDRRHARLHLRPAGVGHADRPDEGQEAGARHDAPALYRRALRRRRRAGVVSRAGRGAGSRGAGLRAARGRGALHHLAVALRR